MASLPVDPPLLSVKSSRVRTARRLARRVSRAEAGRFLAEGPQAVREALALPGCVHEVFALPGRHAPLAATAEAAGIPWLLVDEAAMAALSETVHPQGVVAVCCDPRRPPVRAGR